ncbi:MAG: TIGR01440 family protein [Clostridia bacterium]|nr:TIGR01440 family protein [Clostridia bacterium]
MYENIVERSKNMIEEFLSVVPMKASEILVIGCSSSEIVGESIGKGSNFNAASAVYEGIAPILAEKGIFLAAQCCEHLNRALVVERECAERYGLETVCVVPKAKAGGSFATAAFENFKDPVVVETIKAHAGIDIGDTLIGMHLRAVAVPVRLSVKRLGEANLVFARTRPKYIGGPRACYEA